MTVAIGLVCSDGVLVASDSMSSDGPVASIGKKVREFGRTPAIWTASGSVYVMEEVTTALTTIDASGSDTAPLSIFTTPEPDLIRQKMSPKINAAMRAAYANALNVAPVEPGNVMALTFPTSFLVLGFANGVPWFLEYAHDGQVNWHTDRGFYSIGSGGPFAAVASGLMSHYFEDRPPLEYGKMIAYRTIETTIAVSSQGVGMPVQMAVCDARGTRTLTDDELAEVATGVDRWKVLEQESLRTTPAEAQEEAVGDLPEMPDEVA